jgi:O-antigen ligase
LHPHNAILQVWLELGVVGAGLLALFLVKILILVQKVTRNHWEAAVCYGVFTSGLTISSLSYGIWQSWWLGSLFLAGAFMAVTIQGSVNKNVTTL